MATKLVSMDEAARYLAITVEELTAMRSRGDIYGYRDGASWKFKQDELDRVLAELRSGSSGTPSGGSGIREPEMEALSDTESILVSDEELGHSAEGTSSTVIGGGKKSPGASDINLDAERSDVSLVAGSGIGRSDVELVAGGSDVHSGQRKPKGGSGTGSDMDLAPLDVAASDLELGDAISLGDDLELSPSGSGKKAPLSDIDDLSGGGRSGGGSTGGGISGAGLDDLGLSGSSSGAGIAGGGISGAGLDDLGLSGGGSGGGGATNTGLGSGIDLDMDDDDGVLGGSGSDVTLGAHDSGINLTRPSESGLALDSEPLDLAGGSHVESLELGEDDVVPLDAAADPDLATQLKADDDFLLTPVEETGNQESDSGSQVIALDTEEFDRNAATMIGGGGAAPLLEEEAPGLGPMPSADLSAGLSPGLAPVTQPVSPIGEVPETPYDIFSVLGLAVVALSLSFSGIMMVDLMRNIWSWDTPYSFNSSLMDGIVKMFE